MRTNKTHVEGIRKNIVVDIAYIFALSTIDYGKHGLYMNKLTLEEQETIINYSQADKVASIYTCDPTLIKKMDKLVLRRPTATMEREDEYSKTYLVPKRVIRVQFPNLLSDEQKLKLSLRAKTHLHRKPK